MNKTFRQTELYNFLNYCNENKLDNIILDCGAGGDEPPLALFKQNGYDTFGIELDDYKLEKANEFEKNNDLNLDITKGDMRDLPFEDCSISYVYSYNSIFHMNKNDIERSVREIKRVLKEDGLCYINLLSVDDFQYGKGKELNEGEFLQEEKSEKVVHSYFTEDEADKYFEDFNILLKQNRILERKIEGEKIKQGFIDYICEKPDLS